MPDKGRALVIGGMNIDILGMPEGRFHPGDSLPGSVRLSAGGVGFNIASHLARSGMRVQFVTAIGTDRFSGLAEAACASAGLDISLSLKVKGPSPIYMAIHGHDGALAAAVNDMKAMALLGPRHLEKYRKALSGSFSVCVMDANLPEETLALIPQIVSAPILADPVSCEKGRRLLPVLRQLTAVKPNAMEALALSGCEDVPAAARWFVSQGVRQVYISMGDRGVCCAWEQKVMHLPANRVTSAPSTGAGDAMAAGLARGLVMGKSVPDTARLGLEAAEAYLKAKEGEK